MTSGNYSSHASEIDSYGKDHSWMNSSHATVGYTDQVRHFMDSDEMENPFFQNLQGYGAGGCVLKTERVVKHVTRAPVVSVMMTNFRPYGYSDTGKAENFIRNYGAEMEYTRPGAIHDPRVANFLAQIQSEVNQPITKFSAPFRSNSRAWPISSTGPDADNKNGKTKYDTDDDDHRYFIQGSNQKGSFSAIPQGTNANSVTATNKFSFYQRPNEGHVMQNHTPVSRPVNDINDGVEMLTEGIRNIQSDINRSPRDGSFGLSRWRNGHKTDSDSQDSDSLKQQKNHGMNNKDHEKPEGDKSASKLFAKTNYFQSVSPQQQTRYAVPQNQPAEVKSYSESTNSSEDLKKNGELKPQAVSSDSKAGTFSSDDLIRRYSRAKVPW